VLEELKKQGKTEEQILEEINSYPIPEWLKLRVKGYIENVDFETIESADLSNRNEEIFSIIQQSIGEDFEQLEKNINEKNENLERQLVQLESRLNDRIDRSKAELKQFIGIAVAVGAVGTTGIVALLVFIF
jgi:LPS O-antigen subunit length determinant protein (WzzB/FepE family)